MSVIVRVVLLLLMLEFLVKSTKNNTPFIYSCKSSISDEVGPLLYVKINKQL